MFSQNHKTDFQLKIPLAHYYEIQSFSITFDFYVLE